MFTWLEIGISVQVAWLIMSSVILKLISIKDLLEMSKSEKIGFIVGFVIMACINIAVWPVALVNNVRLLHELSKE